MIVRMTGKLCEVNEQSATIERNGLAHEILIPGYAVGELAAYRGREITLHTLEFYEGNATGGHLVPRLVGFLHPEDKLFFGHFIVVKGIGVRKALKAFAQPIPRIANWIKIGDTKGLAQLPGIGSRAAQLIVAELQGKVDSFAIGQEGICTSLVGQRTQSQQDALEVMVSWGDSRPDAERWLERAVQLNPDLNSADEWIRASYKIKSGSEG